MALPPEAYLWFKTLHIVGVVVWFAGLFYLVRLFIYHVETSELDPALQAPFREQYALMERRLANIITTPGMVVAVTMAVGLLICQPGWLQQGWMHAKLAFVAGLLAYHVLCYRLMGQLQRDACSWSGRQLRALNELPTLLLVLVVMLVLVRILLVGSRSRIGSEADSGSGKRTAEVEAGEVAAPGAEASAAAAAAEADADEDAINA